MGRTSDSSLVVTGANPLHHDVPLLIVQVVLILALSNFLAVFLRPLRQPRVVAEIVGGILLGPSALGYIPGWVSTLFPASSMRILETFASVGLIFYLFLVGMEIDTDSLRKTGASAVGIALSGIFVPFVIGIGVSYVIVMATLHDREVSMAFVVFIGVALSITAFPVLARILAERRLLTTHVGQVAMSAAAVNDVAAWVLLALAVALASSTSNTPEKTGNSKIETTAVGMVVNVTMFAPVVAVPSDEEMGMLVIKAEDIVSMKRPLEQLDARHLAPGGVHDVHEQHNAEGQKSSPLVALWVLLLGAAFVVMMLIVVKPLMIRIACEQTAMGPDQPVSEASVALIFALVLLSAFCTDVFGIHAIFGAFVLGFIIPHKSPFAKALTQRIEDFVSILFLPLYFASSGLKTRVATVNNGTAVGILFLVIATACAGKILGTFVAARLTGLDSRKAWALGVLMNTKGLVELIVLNIGLNKGVITVELFTIMVLMALVTTFMTTPLVMWIYKPARGSLPYTHRQLDIYAAVGEKPTREDDGLAVGHPEPPSTLRLLICVHGMRNLPAATSLTSMIAQSIEISNAVVNMQGKRKTRFAGNLLGMASSFSKASGPSDSAAADKKVQPVPQGQQDRVMPQIPVTGPLDVDVNIQRNSHRSGGESEIDVQKISLSLTPKKASETAKKGILEGGVPPLELDPQLPSGPSGLQIPERGNWQAGDGDKVDQGENNLGLGGGEGLSTEERSKSVAVILPINPPSGRYVRLAAKTKAAAAAGEATDSSKKDGVMALVTSVPRTDSGSASGPGPGNEGPKGRPGPRDGYSKSEGGKAGGGKLGNDLSSLTSADNNRLRDRGLNSQHGATFLRPVRTRLKVYLLHLMELTERSSSIMTVWRARREGRPFWNRKTTIVEEFDDVGMLFEAFGRIRKVACRSVMSISRFEDMHEDICMSAIQKQVQLILLPFHGHAGMWPIDFHYHGHAEMGPVNPRFHHVNLEVLRNPPCSVAVFLDRGLNLRQQRTTLDEMESTKSTCNRQVVVLFFGGPDDREALALGKLLANTPGMTLRVVRFVLVGEVREGWETFPEAIDDIDGVGLSERTGDAGTRNVQAQGPDSAAAPAVPAKTANELAVPLAAAPRLGTSSAPRTSQSTSGIHPLEIHGTRKDDYHSERAPDQANQSSDRQRLSPTASVVDAVRLEMERERHLDDQVIAPIIEAMLAQRRQVHHRRPSYQTTDPHQHLPSSSKDQGGGGNEPCTPRTQKIAMASQQTSDQPATNDNERVGAGSYRGGTTSSNVDESGYESGNSDGPSLSATHESPWSRRKARLVRRTGVGTGRRTGADILQHPRPNLTCCGDGSADGDRKPAKEDSSFTWGDYDLDGRDAGDVGDAGDGGGRVRHHHRCSQQQTSPPNVFFHVRQSENAILSTLDIATHMQLDGQDVLLLGRGRHPSRFHIESGGVKEREYEEQLQAMSSASEGNQDSCHVKEADRDGKDKSEGQYHHHHHYHHHYFNQGGATVTTNGKSSVKPTKDAVGQGRTEAVIPITSNGIEGSVEGRSPGVSHSVAVARESDHQEVQPGCSTWHRQRVSDKGSRPSTPPATGDTGTGGSLPSHTNCAHCPEARAEVDVLGVLGAAIAMNYSQIPSSLLVVQQFDANLPQEAKVPKPHPVHHQFFHHYHLDFLHHMTDDSQHHHHHHHVHHHRRNRYHSTPSIPYTAGDV